MFTEEQKQIYKELVENTKLPLKEIARRIGLSYNTFQLYTERGRIVIERRFIESPAQQEETK